MWNSLSAVATFAAVTRKVPRHDPQRAVQAVGSRIRALRRSAGWTLELLAERAGVHPNFLGLLERGQKNPSVEVLDRIARGLGVDLATLVDLRQGAPGPELRAIIRERLGAMTDEQLLRVLRVLDAVR